MKPMLAKNLKGQDVSGWFMSEKFDGVRALWDGKVLRSRNGRKFNPPKWWTADLPDVPLDGELWIAHGEFQLIASTVRKRYESKHWPKVKYVVFDAPEFPASYKSRLEFLVGLHLGGVVLVPSQHVCEDVAHARNFCEGVCSVGGEGIILRHPEALYQEGRSDAMLKLKPFDTDEAKVVGHDGRAILCRWNRQEFKIGSGVPHDDLPYIGSRITFKYMGLTNHGIPRHAALVAERDYE
jgi:DNA ligase 1